MIDILRDIVWQVMEVLINILLVFIGFYYIQKQRVWSYISTATIILIALPI